MTPRQMHQKAHELRTEVRRFQKAMGGDGYFVEYASVGEIADAVVDLIVEGEGK